MASAAADLLAAIAGLGEPTWRAVDPGGGTVRPGRPAAHAENAAARSAGYGLRVITWILHNTANGPDAATLHAMLRCSAPWPGSPTRSASCTAHGSIAPGPHRPGRRRPSRLHSAVVRRPSGPAGLATTDYPCARSRLAARDPAAAAASLARPRAVLPAVDHTKDDANPYVHKGHPYWFSGRLRTCAQVPTRAHPPERLDRPNRARRQDETRCELATPTAPGPGRAGRPVLTGTALTSHLRLMVAIQPGGDAPQQFVFHPGWGFFRRVVQPAGRKLSISHRASPGGLRGARPGRHGRHGRAADS